MMSNWPKITSETPIEEIQKIHKDIWQYTMEHGCKPYTPYHSDCACCEYVVQHGFVDHNRLMCSKCPAIWGTEVDSMTRHCFCRKEESPYEKWLNILPLQYDAMARYAEQVRDIPFKYELEEKNDV